MVTIWSNKRTFRTFIGKFLRLLHRSSRQYRPGRRYPGRFTAGIPSPSDSAPTLSSSAPGEPWARRSSPASRPLTPKGARRRTRESLYPRIVPIHSPVEYRWQRTSSTGRSPHGSTRSSAQTSVRANGAEIDRLPAVIQKSCAGRVPDRSGPGSPSIGVIPSGFGPTAHGYRNRMQPVQIRPFPARQRYCISPQPQLAR